ncbi:hypothetical protein EVAR_18001_1 [Eumeta japonica]|uniref:Uncharacterized protein n=1 Tax=Eumeta variegata TaxID=151549 RepID=A0A4C1Y5M0_EUMVA|nr:hypothetical protein EVAR_18001_1 [Eumeta japonica]
MTVDRLTRYEAVFIARMFYSELTRFGGRRSLLSNTRARAARKQSLARAQLACAARMTLRGLGCLAGGGGCVYLCASYLYRMRTGKRNRHRRPDSPNPNPKSKRDDISINQLT